MADVEAEGDAYPDRLVLIREIAGESVCTACEAQMTKRHFRVVKRGDPTLGRILCWVCAKEIAYGIVPQGLPLQSFGGRSALPEDEDANGCRSNAMRSLED